MAHVSARFAPHSRQNLACGGFSCWHRGHFMRAVPLGLGIIEYAVCRNAYRICSKTSLSMLSLGRRACFRLLPRDLRWSALSTLLEAQMITGKTAVSLMARGGTKDCAVSPVHNVFHAPPPHARLPGNLVSSGVNHGPGATYHQASFSGLLHPQQQTQLAASPRMPALCH